MYDKDYIFDVTCWRSSVLCVIVPFDDSLAHSQNITLNNSKMICISLPRNMISDILTVRVYCSNFLYPKQKQLKWPKRKLLNNANESNTNLNTLHSYTLKLYLMPGIQMMMIGVSQPLLCTW